jgi:hypothetical protein
VSDAVLQLGADRQLLAVALGLADDGVEHVHAGGVQERDAREVEHDRAVLEVVAGGDAELRRGGQVDLAGDRDDGAARVGSRRHGEVRGLWRLRHRPER